MKAALPALAVCAALAACVPAAPAPTPAPAARPSPPTATAPRPVPAAPLPSNWMDRPRTPGIWQYGSGTRAEAVFLGQSQSGSLPLARLRCERERGVVVLSLPESDAPRPGVTVRTEFMSQRLEAAPAGRETLVTFNPRDPLLDAMALSKGRFMIEGDGLAPLILPSWPEVSRVIEDCR